MMLQLRLRKQLVQNDEGVTSIEYAVIAFGVAFAILMTVSLLGSDLESQYDNLNTTTASSESSSGGSQPVSGSSSGSAGSKSVGGSGGGGGGAGGGDGDEEDF